MSQDTRNLGQTIESLTQRAHLLMREEIALLKAEVAEAASKVSKGAVVGIVAGFFAIWALLMMFFGLASLITWAIGGAPFWGYFIVMLLLLILAAVAGLVAARLVKSGAQKPTMAIDEAKLIKETVQSDNPTATVGKGAA
jgi:hypothetical protein